MSAKKKVIFIVIPLLTVTIGWIMEIMPNAVGEEMQKVFGEQYPLFWWVITILLVSALIICSYWSAADDSNGSGNSETSKPSGNNQYTQNGDKSIMIKENNGNINIH